MILNNFFIIKMDYTTEQVESELYGEWLADKYQDGFSKSAIPENSEAYDEEHCRMNIPEHISDLFNPLKKEFVRSHMFNLRF